MPASYEEKWAQGSSEMPLRVKPISYPMAAPEVPNKHGGERQTLSHRGPGTGAAGQPCASFNILLPASQVSFFTFIYVFGRIRP